MMRKARGTHCIKALYDIPRYMTTTYIIFGGEILPYLDFWRVDLKVKKNTQPIGTWNMKIMMICGSLENVKRAMEKLQLSVRQ